MKIIIRCNPTLNLFFALWIFYEASSLLMPVHMTNTSLIFKPFTATTKKLTKHMKLLQKNNFNFLDHQKHKQQICRLLVTVTRVNTYRCV